MAEKNYIKLPIKSLFYYKYTYVDARKNRIGDRIFEKHKIDVKVWVEQDDGEHNEYQMANCKVRKKDEEELLKAFAEFKDTMLLLGHTDYEEYCSGIIPFYEEGL